MKVSVAICTYNGARHLALQLTSILQQKVPVQEIVICDDGSTDNTITIINGLQKLHPDIIILQQNKSNLGAKKNFEQAIQLCSGDFIFLSDQDDVWLPHKVATTLHFFEKTPEAAVVFSNGKLINDDGKILNYSIWDSIGFSQKLRSSISPAQFFELLIIINNIVTGATLCIKKDSCDYLLPFFCPDNYWHDYWIALASAYKNQLYFIDDELILYRLHQNQQASLPEINSHYQQQNKIKEMQWLQVYDQLHTNRFLYYNIGARRRIDQFKPRLNEIFTNTPRFKQLNNYLLNELRILKLHLFSQMSFAGKKKLALISILGRQKTLNIKWSDILKLIFS